MSKISLRLDQNTVPADVLAGLHKTIGKSMLSIHQSIKSNLPIAEYKLFYNDHEEVSLKLKNIASLLADKDISFSMYELDEDDAFIDSHDTDIDKIDLETMVNILDSHGKN